MSKYLEYLKSLDPLQGLDVARVGPAAKVEPGANVEPSAMTTHRPIEMPTATAPLSHLVGISCL